MAEVKLVLRSDKLTEDELNQIANALQSMLWKAVDGVASEADVSATVE